LLGIASVMFGAQRKTVLRAPGDAAAYLELPELGAIPQANRWMPAGFFFAGSSRNRVGIERIALEQRDGLAESFRATAASILSAGNNGAGPRLLVVTSSQPTEGKTTIVSNLGIALAAISHKVLLIDGDMRRPRLHKLFDEANSWGLSDVLREKNAIDELPIEVLAKKTSVPHLYLLPSGASTDNIFGLLYSGRMSRLMPLFREQFDYVIVDAPPCLEFADARIMARYAEELLLVVRANYTDRRTVQAAVQRLRLDGLPLMGIILNRWDPAPGDPYAYRTFRSDLRQGIA
jgi:receptor protein-tyrosine kinase